MRWLPAQYTEQLRCKNIFYTTLYGLNRTLQNRKHFFSIVQRTVCNTFSHPPFCLSSDLASVSFNDPFAIQLFGRCPFKWDYFVGLLRACQFIKPFMSTRAGAVYLFLFRVNATCFAIQLTIIWAQHIVKCNVVTNIWKSSQACAVKVIWDCKGPFPFCGDFPRRGFVIWMSKLESVKVFLRKGFKRKYVF